MPEPQEPQQQQGGAPPGDGGFDGDAIGKIVEERVKAAFAAALKEQPAGGGEPPAQGKGGTGTPPPPATPSPDGGGGNFADAINAAVTRALAQRDQEDAVVVLGREIDELKQQLARKPEARRNWATWLLGPGLPR